MRTEQEIDPLFQQSLEALENLDPQTPEPFLYTRIMAKMQASDNIPAWSVKLSLASLIILIALNIGYILGGTSNKSGSETASGLQAFSEEYNLSTTQNF